MANAPRPLVGKVAAVTGGARGIGRATAAALLARGIRVAIGDIDASLAEQTAVELGADTVGLPLDVTSRESFSAFLTETESRLGPLDVLVNNAGIMPVGPFLEESDAIARALVDINLHGVIFGSKLALERFQARGRGHLVNVASIVGKSASPHLATYVATKHAVVGLTEALRMEFASSGIDFSVVMPVGTNTELYSGLQQIRGIKTPEPEDVAEAIVEALQTGRVDVYVPRRMGATIRLAALMPRRVADTISQALGGNDAVTHPDRAVRAAYEQRIGQGMTASDPAQAVGTPAKPGGSPAESQTPEAPDGQPDVSQPEINSPISTPASS
ncbi:MAG TPA: SDR family oxidoreductase [Solirubrobacteraceae bacterium]|nr:SDR family oxidoreductase [Solirubrobacteraceae bacterium]